MDPFAAEHIKLKVNSTGWTTALRCAELFLLLLHISHVHTCMLSSQLYTCLLRSRNPASPQIYYYQLVSGHQGMLSWIL